MAGPWVEDWTPSSVDWCEPNYVVSPHVAEWWNTLSSFPISIGALLGLGLLFASSRPRELRFIFGYGLVFVVGLGSAAFHGTLSKLGQALDELPMVAVGLVFVYSVRFRSSPRPPPLALERKMRRVWLGLSIYGLAFLGGYLLLPAYFTLFILTYAALITYLVVETARVSFVVAPSPVRKLWFVLAAGSYVGGVLLLWLPENVFLSCSHPLQAMQLHAWFHLSSAFGSFAWLRWAVLDRHPAPVDSGRSGAVR